LLPSPASLTRQVKFLPPLFSAFCLSLVFRGPSSFFVAVVTVWFSVWDRLVCPPCLILAPFLSVGLGDSVNSIFSIPLHAEYSPEASV